MKLFLIFGVILFLTSCKSSYLKYDKIEQLNKNDEFEKQVKIIPAGLAPTTLPESGVAKKAPTQIPSEVKSKGKKRKTKLANKKNEVAATQREPDLEDTEGFGLARRPLVDPFRVGEEVVHDVHYFKVSAGELAFKVEPFVEVNGQKSYSFATEIRSGRMFSSFYSVDDRAVTLMDFNLMIPRVFTLDVKESAQLRQAKSYFDFDQMKATYWEKKVTEKDGKEEKKLQWDILSYSQNVFSTLFYMRLFKWEVGKQYSFRVAHDQENLTFKGTALRKEKLKTEAGEFSTIVVKPEMMVKGLFKPMGDIYIWLSDDDRKYILRIECSIRIGTLVSEVVKLNPGQP
ncbi:MAG: DUF3108 domain-containing protein [Bdellovibrionota bacterium]